MSFVDGAAAEELEDLSLEEGEEPPVELTVEQRARAKGWKPLEEYHGDPGRWRDAETFLRIGDHDNSILREENRRLTTQGVRMGRQLEKLEKTQGELKDALDEMTKLARRSDERGYQRAKQELLTQRKEAVASGDTVSFEQIEQQLEALGADHAPAPATPAPPAAPAQPTIAPEIRSFISQNPWYTNDQELQRTMIEHLAIVERRNPTMAMADQLDLAKERTIADYPERFEDMPSATPPARLPPRSAAPTVARPSASALPPPRRAGADPFAVIEDPAERAEARSGYDRIKRADPGMTTTEYMALYTNPHADALDLRRNRKA